MTRLVGLSVNMSAFLDMIAWSELGPDLLRKSDDGYNVLVGATAVRPLLFADYSTHPNVLNKNIPVPSTAAGRYQFLYRYWPAYRKQLNLPDFGPLSQDQWAVQLIRECGKAYPQVQLGIVESAITACASRWASLPGNSYGQHAHKVSDLIAVYVSKGGIVTH